MFKKRKKKNIDDLSFNSFKTNEQILKEEEEQKERVEYYKNLSKEFFELYINPFKLILEYLSSEETPFPRYNAEDDGYYFDFDTNITDNKINLILRYIFTNDKAIIEFGNQFYKFTSNDFYNNFITHYSIRFKRQIVWSEVKNYITYDEKNFQITLTKFWEDINSELSKKSLTQIENAYKIIKEKSENIDENVKEDEKR